RASLLLVLACHCSSETTTPGGAIEAPPPGSGGTSSEPSAPPSSEVGGASSVDGMMPGDLVGAAGTSPLAPVVPDAGSVVVPDAGAPATPPFTGSFILGADISSVQEAVEQGAAYVDTDGTQKSLLALLANHGFNYVRLRTFVEPSAQYGYASGDGCQARNEPYNDRDHTVAFAREVKAAGLGYLLDLHYSDTWADPGKQVIPEAWREIATLDALAEQVRAYTVDVVAAMVAAGARPDMVQVGNEITPGMLIHVPTATTDCYGNNSVVRQGVNGSAANWDNLATLLRAGIAGVREVDDTIQIMLHVENTESAAGVGSWVRDALERDVDFDVLGLSAYEAFQGPASEWRATLTQLAGEFPELRFAIAEYNPQRRLLNDIMRELPDGRGLGTFFWEPTQSGSWGQALFDFQGNTLLARPADFAEYDQLRSDYGL
ncbi:MAG: glycosyl hydrolase 53 family protein, partial [Polyangiaceae bacterium]